MRRRFRPLACVLLLLVFVAACAVAGKARAAPVGAVEYEVAIPKPHTQYVEVAMRVSPGRERSTRVAMPAWTPGSYLIREFARHVYDLRAETASGQPLPVRRLDKQTWEVEHGRQPFLVRYRVFAAERSVRTSHVDDTHASLNGASVFLYLPGHLDAPCRVEISPPSGWQAFTALESVPGHAGELVFVAADYDALVDAPIELGTPRTRAFTVDGVQFEYVLTGAADGSVDIDRLADEARRIVTAFGKLMGGFPMRRYVFLASVTESGGGGLEHADSTMMMMRRAQFRSEEGYRAAARLVAHEFFHLWNVKRIHDEALSPPFDYARENHSRLLWFHEGFTETAETYALVRAGLVPPKQFVSDLAHTWTDYLRHPGRNHDPISEISFEAWIKAYRPAPNHRNVSVSYYRKGHLIGIVLDLELRLRAQAHGGQGDLFGLFRRLMASHAAKGKGIELDDIIAAASVEAGEDMRPFFDRYVTGTDELSLPELVEKMGVTVGSHPPWANADGTTTGRDLVRDRRLRVYGGLELDDDEIRSIDPDSPAERAGLMRGDQIIAVDGHRTSDDDDIEDRLGLAGPGQTTTLTLFRHDQLHHIELRLEENPHRNFTFTLPPLSELPPERASLRQSWLSTLPP